MHSSDIPPRSSGIVYCFDLDGTICTTVEMSEYKYAEPDVAVVDEINRLYCSGNIIKIMTARGSVSGVDYTELTKNQLAEWGVKYDELIMNKKPYADLFIDDRGMHIDDWKKLLVGKKGIVAGAFDIIHVGYVRMFEHASRHCDHLTVALHVDPSSENGKTSPVNSVDDREEVLRSIFNVHDVIRYETEKDLYKILSSGDYDVRFLGEDYRKRPYTGTDLSIEINWVSRDHGYSTSMIKERIRQAV